ncbi:MAG: hypothetical protein ACJA06_002049, partial [Halocynthiibacter sp.]
RDGRAQIRARAAKEAKPAFPKEMNEY